MRFFRRAESGQSRDLASADSGERRDAGACRLPVDEDGAGAALAEAAAETRIVQAEVIAQRIEERHVWVVDLDCLCLAIDNEREALGHQYLLECEQKDALFATLRQASALEPRRFRRTCESRILHVAVMQSEAGPINSSTAGTHHEG